MTPGGDDRAARLALKRRLGRTWGAFFERHGNFTAVQVAAIPPLLAGQNTVLCAPTASGKTEAALVPLLERHCVPGDDAALTLLYLTPTRALVNDLLGRLAVPLELLRISFASKTRDLTTFNPQAPAQLLLSTPESIDSLLTAHARCFANLKAVVIDELHLFDGTPRGDQLRVLLRRLQQVRTYAAAQQDAPDDTLQYVALSATLANPQQVAARYFAASAVIRVASVRAHEIELLPLAPDSTAELLAYLATFRARGWRKALVFCNSRAEVESYTTALQQRSPFGNAVFAHYSNIAPQRRLEIEAQFAMAEVAICVATSTLELGIDVGNIDVVILIGPPGDVKSFEQRIGRGNRRSSRLHGACFYRSPLERLLFEALNTAWGGERAHDAQGYFRPAVMVQQLFSLIKQSPTGSVRLKLLMQLFEGLLSADDIRAIVGHLQQLGYLVVGRPGEWRPGDRLNDLFDRQASAYCELSIYSNIRGAATRPVEVRDHYTHQTVASVDAQWLYRPLLTLEGRTLDVKWIDGEAMWVTTTQPATTTGRLYHQGRRKYLQFALAQALPPQFGLDPHQTPVIAAPDGWWWFHWLGDLYGHALFDLLKPHLSIDRTSSPGLCLILRDDPRTFSLPSWQEPSLRHYIGTHYRSLERMLDVGPFQELLPSTLRRRAVIEQFNIATFIEAVSKLSLIPAPESADEHLLALVQ